MWLRCGWDLLTHELRDDEIHTSRARRPPSHSYAVFDVVEHILVKSDGQFFLGSHLSLCVTRASHAPSNVVVDLTVPILAIGYRHPTESAKCALTIISVCSFPLVKGDNYGVE